LRASNAAGEKTEGIRERKQAKDEISMTSNGIEDGRYEW
jgi:hypothetical protein